MKYILFSLLLASCQMAPPKYGIRREYSVKSRLEAESIVNDKVSFLIDTYEQFQNPLYRYTKFSAECLSQLSLGKETETSEGFVSVTTAFFSKDLGAGLCPEQYGSQKGLFVFVYCSNENKLYQIICPVDQCGEVHWESQC